MTGFGETSSLLNHNPTEGRGYDGLGCGFRSRPDAGETSMEYALIASGIAGLVVIIAPGTGPSLAVVLAALLYVATIYAVIEEREMRER
jgi:hypothetical protein